MPSGMSIVTYAAPAASASVSPLSGDPRTENLPSLSSMSSGAASSWWATIALTLAATLLAARAAASPPTASEREP